MIWTLSLFSLTLHFDGSLRPPRDPIPGFTRYTPKSLNIDKMASCSAAILSDNNDKVHSIGGKMLTLMPGMTSADAEYEGLLMGLDKLRSYLSNNENLDSFMSNPNASLNVKGDCKVIVDQFQGTSSPRKMEMKYNLAMDKIRSIQNICSAHPQSARKLSVRFQHIPRDDNHLCDAICRLLVNQKQRLSVTSIYESIKLGEAETSGTLNKPIKKATKKKKRTTKNVHFQSALDGIISSTELDVQLCHSSQLALACVLTSAAIQQKDAIILLELAEFYLLMSRRWGRIYFYEDVNSWEVKNALADLSTACKDLAADFSKRGAKDENSAEMDDISEVLQSLYGFFTRTNDMNRIDGIQSPFMDVSDLVDEVDQDSWTEAQRWDLLATDAIQRDIATLESGVWMS